MSKPKTTPAPVEVPQSEIDIANLQKEVKYLTDKVKLQGSQLQTMHTVCSSCEGVVNELRRQVKNLSELSGV